MHAPHVDPPNRRRATAALVALPWLWTGARAQPETILDAQIGYTFEKEGSFLNGVQVLAEVFNLTNEPFVTENVLQNAAGTAVVGTFPSRHELYGRTFQFTIRKSF